MNDEIRQNILENFWQFTFDVRGRLPIEQMAGWLLGLPFLKWVCSGETLEENNEQGFRIPFEAQWEFVVATHSQGLVQRLSEAVRLLETNNPQLDHLFTRGNLFPGLDSQTDIPLAQDLARFVWELVAYLENNHLFHDREELSQFFGGLIHRLALEMKHFGADFASPPSIKKLMIELMQPDIEERIFDPVCGTAGFLVEAFRRVSPKNWNTTLYGQDISAIAISIARMNLILSGAHYELKQASIFDEECWRDSDGKIATFDVVIANPPFSQLLQKANLRRYRSPEDAFEIEHLKTADYVFLQQAITSMNDNGRCALIAPLGMLFRKGAEQKIRQKLIERDLFEAIIQLPGGLFYGNLVPACIMILRKTKSSGRKDKILFVDASKLKVEASRIKSLTSESIQIICEQFHEFKETQFLSKVVTLQELEKNAYDLSVERYVRSSQVTHRPIVEIMSELKQLQQEQSILCEDLMSATSSVLNARKNL